MHEPIAAVAVCPKPVQDQTGKHSSMEWGEIHGTPFLRAMDSSWSLGVGDFFKGLALLGRLSTLQWMPPHPGVCGKSI